MNLFIKTTKDQIGRRLDALVMRLSEIRRLAFWKLHLWSGRKEGDLMSRWVLCLWCVARPVTIIEMLAARCINPASDIVKIGSMQFTLHLFRMLDTSPTPGPWFRVIRREDGALTLEQKFDA